MSSGRIARSPRGSEVYAKMFVSAPREGWSSSLRVFTFTTTSSSSSSMSRFIRPAATRAGRDVRAAAAAAAKSMKETIEHDAGVYAP